MIPLDLTPPSSFSSREGVHCGEKLISAENIILAEASSVAVSVASVGDHDLPLFATQLENA